MSGSRTCNICNTSRATIGKGGVSMLIEDKGLVSGEFNTQCMYCNHYITLLHIFLHNRSGKNALQPPVGEEFLIRNRGLRFYEYGMPADIFSCSLPIASNNSAWRGKIAMIWNGLDARNALKHIWGDLRSRILQNPTECAKIAKDLAKHKKVYQGIENILPPPTCIDSLIKELGDNKSHDKFLNKLAAIDIGITIEEKLDLLSSLEESLVTTKENLWLIDIQAEMCRVIIAKRKKEDIEKKMNTIMKLGPDMPESLASAMARETIPQAQAAQIFREGWHREPLTTKIMKFLLAGKLNFENASWMQKNLNHEQMIQALLEGKMDLEVAKHLLNIGFGDNPLATAAILEGNDIELVASMYGIVLPVVEGVIEDVPEVEAVPEPVVVEETPEWRGRFDDT
jgi:hypothetical protein